MNHALRQETTDRDGSLVSSMSSTEKFGMIVPTINDESSLRVNTHIYPRCLSSSAY